MAIWLWWDGRHTTYYLIAAARGFLKRVLRVAMLSPPLSAQVMRLCPERVPRLRAS